MECYIYLHSTLVRFYGICIRFDNNVFPHLHSTLVRFYAFFAVIFRITFQDLHSTLVRFYGKKPQGKRNEMYYLHSTLVRFYGYRLPRLAPICFIYIPHWLDSMVFPGCFLRCSQTFTFHTG